MQAFLLCAFLTLLLGSAQSATTGTVRTEEAKTPWFCHDLDCPPFSVEDASVDTDIELRSYDAGRGIWTWLQGLQAEGWQGLRSLDSGVPEEWSARVTEPYRAAKTIRWDGSLCQLWCE